MEKTPRFAFCIANTLRYLREKGWVMSNPGLKVPYTTSPDGRIRLWFKPQSVHLSQLDAEHPRHALGNAHSLFIDIRKATPEQVLTCALEYAELDAPDDSSADLDANRDSY